MPLLFERNDITQMNTDAIVIPANEDLLQGSGTSRGIFKAAGEKSLEAACRELGHCDMGQAVLTGGFDLNARYIIHAVCPRWYDGESNERELLYSAYASALQLAGRFGLRSVAFPLLSSGNYEYPKDQALNVACHAISDFLLENDMDVYLVFYDKASVKSGNRILIVNEAIGDEYVDANDECYGCQMFQDLSAGQWRSLFPKAREKWERGRQYQKNLDLSNLFAEKSKAMQPVSQERLDELLRQVDAPFSTKLKAFVDRSQKSNKEIYACSNMKKKQFYKLLQDPYVTPKKTTVLGLAVGLELNISDTKALLASAGYALSPSSGADVIVECFIRNRNYNYTLINSALYDNGFGDYQIGTTPRLK